LDGTVRFALTKDQLVTTGGTIKGVTTHFDKDFNVISTTTSSTKVVEPKPDLYFRVNMPDGSVIDTRKLPGGFMLNFQSARIGTLAQPRIFTFGATGTGVLEATV
jgi:hypothetical protein